MPGEVVTVMDADLYDQLAREHVPFDAPVPGYNKPAEGVPIQCRKCLHAYPCATRILLDRVIELEAAIIDAAHQIDLVADAYRQQYGELPEVPD